MGDDSCDSHRLKKDPVTRKRCNKAKTRVVLVMVSTKICQGAAACMATSGLQVEVCLYWRAQRQILGIVDENGCSTPHLLPL